MKLYESLADDLATQIRSGVYRPGERLPSVRQTHQQRRVSITTVLRAYLLLEARGLAESRPQSGFFVRAPAGIAPRTAPGPAPLEISASVDVSRLVLTTLRAISADDAVPLGSPYPDTSRFPIDKLTRYVYAAGQRACSHQLHQSLPPGHQGLIRQIARRHGAQGLVVDPAEIIVTLGATEAINLCLQAVAKPGDVIAVESPTFYAMLHAIERLGMRAVEVPTDPERGLDVDALARIAAGQPLAACMVMPNFQNPLGFEMPHERKRALVDLARRADLPLIENAVYNELYHGDAPPTTLKGLDRDGRVLLCGSFSKTLSPDYRVGWALPGRYRDAMEKLKFLNTLVTPAQPQIAIANFLERDGYDQHLRRLRKAYAQQASLMKATVTRFFPAGTRVSSPMGGYVLWVELPPGVDGLQLYQQALAQGITVGPGYMFSASNRYAHFVRLNYSAAWTPAIEQAVITVGRLAAALTPAESR